MNIITNITTAATRQFGRIAFKGKKAAPEILIGLGIVGIAGATYWACRATLKLDGVMEEHKDRVETVKHEKEEAEAVYDAQHDEALISDSDYNDGITLCEKGYKKDLTHAYLRTGFEVVKLYAPAVTLEIVSVAAILGGYGILKKRTVMLLGAYKTLDETFRGYRERVGEAVGEEREREIYHGLHKETITEEVTGEDGKTKKEKRTELVKDDKNVVSRFARFFDESSPYWSKDASYNLLFLRNQLNFFNDLLNARGYVMLSEVYEALGIQPTSESLITGWIKQKGDPENKIDFGIYNILNEKARDFVNGYERCILLDFNVDGLIWDRI